MALDEIGLELLNLGSIGIAFLVQTALGSCGCQPGAASRVVRLQEPEGKGGRPKDGVVRTALPESSGAGAAC